ncbi:MAG: type II toxin-antitoxin system VapC family toxin [Beijerinckiaceae bacterium]
MAIEIIVNDSSCLIDLRKGGLLTTALLLPFRFVVALPLISAELHDFTKTDWDDLQVRGLQVIDLNSAQVARAFALKAQFAGLSPYDCFSLALVEATDHSMLLTGDQQLRRRASTLGVNVHGILWLCDEMERAGKLTFAELADALEILEADPLVFLPRNEVRIRIERLRAQARGR